MQIDEIVENTQALIRKDLLLLDTDQPKQNTHTTALNQKYDIAVEKLHIAKLEISNIQREQKALELVGNVSVLNSHLALVLSQSKKASYKVDYVNNTCECPDHKYRGVQCKHIQAVKQVIMEYAS